MKCIIPLFTIAFLATATPVGLFAEEAAEPPETALPEAKDKARIYSRAKYVLGIGFGGYADVEMGYHYSLHISYERKVGKGLLELAVRPSYQQSEDSENPSYSTFVLNGGVVIDPAWHKETDRLLDMEIGVLYSFRHYREFPLKNGRSAFIMNLWRPGLTFGWRIYASWVLTTDLGTYKSNLDNNWSNSNFMFGITYKPEVGFRITEKFAVTLDMPFQIRFFPEYIWYPIPSVGTHLNI